MINNRIKFSAKFNKIIISCATFNKIGGENLYQINFHYTLFQKCNE